MERKREEQRERDKERATEYEERRERMRGRDRGGGERVKRRTGADERCGVTRTPTAPAMGSDVFRIRRWLSSGPHFKCFFISFRVHTHACGC